MRLKLKSKLAALENFGIDQSQKNLINFGFLVDVLFKVYKIVIISL